MSQSGSKIDKRKILNKRSTQRQENPWLSSPWLVNNGHLDLGKSGNPSPLTPYGPDGVAPLIVHKGQIPPIALQGYEGY